MAGELLSFLCWASELLCLLQSQNITEPLRKEKNKENKKLFSWIPDDILLLGQVVVIDHTVHLVHYHLEHHLAEQYVELKLSQQDSLLGILCHLGKFCIKRLYV